MGIEFQFCKTKKKSENLFYNNLKTTGFPGGSVVKNLPVSVGDGGSIPGFQRFPGGRNCNSLQYSCLGTSMDRGAWWVEITGVTNRWTWLSIHTQHCCTVHLKMVQMVKKINSEYLLEGLLLKLKLQYFGHLMWGADSLEKTLMLGKTEGMRRRGRQRMRWLGSITDSMSMNLSRLWETVEDRGAWCAAVSPWCRK